MKKYFMKESGEELQFGDIIELDLTKDVDNHTIHKHYECKFHPSLIQQLLDDDIIIEKDLLVEPADDDIDDEYSEFECFMGTMAEFMDKIDLLIDTLDSLTAVLKANTKANVKTSGK